MHKTTYSNVTIYQNKKTQLLDWETGYKERYQWITILHVSNVTWVEVNYWYGELVRLNTSLIVLVNPLDT